MNSVDPNTTVVANDTAAVTNSSAKSAPQVESKEQTITATSTEAVKAARYAEANATLEAAAKAETDKAAAEAIAVKEAETAKAKEADTVGQLSAKLAAKEAEAAALVSKAGLAEKMEAVSALVTAGKHYEAIQLLSESTGLSFDEAVQQVVNPGAVPKPAAAKPEAKATDPEVVKLKEQLDAVTKKLADADAAAAAMNKEQGRRSVVEHVKAKAVEFPYLASNEAWVSQALADAEPDYAKAIEANKGEDIAIEAKNELITKALAAAEAKHKAAAEAYAAVAKPGAAAKTPNSVTKVAQPTLTFTGARAGVTPAAKTGKAASLDELKKARRQSAN